MSSSLSGTLNVPTDKVMSKFIWNIYKSSSFTIRILASARTYICPLQPLLSRVPFESSVFDIGCGNGLFLVLVSFFNKAKYVCGVEPNKLSVSTAEIVTRKINFPDKPIIYDFRAVSDPSDWPTRSFSVVSMIDVMHHIPINLQKQSFKEAAARVEKSGIFLYKDMCRYPLWRAWFNRFHDLVLARQWINYVDIKDIKVWASECGLALEEEKHYTRLAYGHELLVFRRS